MAVGIIVFFGSTALSVTTPVPCPSKITGYLLVNGQFTNTQVSADLVPAQSAATLTGSSSYVGLLAVYTIEGGYTVGQVAIPGFGGIASNTWGLLNGYRYNADGSCTSVPVYTSSTTSTASSSSSSSSSSTSSSTSSSSTASSSTASSGAQYPSSFSPGMNTFGYGQLIGLGLVGIGGFLYVRERKR